LALPEPFLVLATQNPIEYEGTFPLPEAQLDRFMLKLTVGYPSLAEEKEILHRRHQRQQEDVVLSAVTDSASVMEMRRVVETIHVDPDLEMYIAEIVHETRVERRVAVGSSPRGSLAFLKMARAHAALQGRAFILPDDIKRFALPVLGHRLIMQPEYWMGRGVAADVIADVFERVAVPIVKGV